MGNGRGNRRRHRATLRYPERGKRMRSKRRMQLVLAVAVSLFLAACTSGKETATAAIKAAEDALSAERSEAVKFVPDVQKKTGSVFPQL